MKSRIDSGTTAAERGFSLLEVLVATAVLAIGVLGVAQLFLLAIHQNERAQQNTQAANILAHRMEQLREVDFCKLQTASIAGGGNWVRESAAGKLDGENMGWGGDPKVFAGREAKEVGGLDWVIERRLLTSTMIGGEVDKQPVDGLLLIELRGYKRGVKSRPTKPNWVYMSTYRTNRAETCP